MKFKNLEQLIEFEKNVQWLNADEVKLDSLKVKKEVETRINRLKGNKIIGVCNGEAITAVSDQFSIISVNEIADACDKEFGSNFIEKSYREGIVRVYETGIEDSKGKVTPLVVYPANLGNMSVRIGLHHNAFVCSNGLLIADGLLSYRVIHRLNEKNLNELIRNVSSNCGLVLNKVRQASQIEMDQGYQLAMIVQGLGMTDKLVRQALSKYAPQDNTLWSAIQAITYVSTHETREGFDYARNAGTYLMNQSLMPHEIIEAASYAFTKEQKGVMNFENSKKLYSIARQILA